MFVLAGLLSLYTTSFLVQADLPKPLHRCESKIVYPVTKKGKAADTIAGTKIPDPFRWLEEYGHDDVRAWIKKQNDLTTETVKWSPATAAVRKRLGDGEAAGEIGPVTWMFKTKGGRPKKAGNYYFFMIEELSSGKKLVFRSKTKRFKDREIVINTDSWKGNVNGEISFSDNYQITKDGKYLVYVVNRYESDWMEIHVHDLIKNKPLENETVEWLKNNAFLVDFSETGFFYAKYSEPGLKYLSPNKKSRVYFHRLGTPHTKDRFVFEDTDALEVTVDLDYHNSKLIVQSLEKDGTHNILYADVPKKNEAPKWKTMIPPGLGEFSLFMMTKKHYLFIHKTKTNGGKLISVPVNNPAPNHWVEVIPERPGAILEEIYAVNEWLISEYMVEGLRKVFAFSSKNGKSFEIPLPGPGNVSDFSAGGQKNDIDFYFDSFQYPNVPYAFNTRSEKLNALDPNNPEWKDLLNNYEHKFEWYPSKDGTQVPLHLFHKKGLKLDSNHPVYLYGYGSAAHSETPHYLDQYKAWADLGGVVAIAGVRGGGERGPNWFLSGTGMNKQNSIDDFNAAAEWLIKNKYTKAGKIGAVGYSAGAVLVAAAAIQRPELYGAIVSGSGTHDIIRQKEYTLGQVWTVEDGDPANKEVLQYLLTYSPLQTVTPKKYPAFLIITGEKDDRVVSAHSYKLTAALQAAQQGTEPILLRSIANRSHQNSSQPQYIEEVTEITNFFIQELGIVVPDDFK